MLCELCYGDENREYFSTSKVVTEVSVAEMTSLSSGYLTPSSRRSIFLCCPCIDRVQAAGKILSRWKGKLNLVVPQNQIPTRQDNNNNAVSPDGNSFGIQDLGGRFQAPAVPSSSGLKFPPMIKSSASVDSGITFDSDSNGEFFEAEDVSRPSTAFASAEEDEAESSPFVSLSSAHLCPAREPSPPVGSSPGAIGMPFSSASTNAAIFSVATQAPFTSGSSPILAPNNAFASLPSTPQPSTPHPFSSPSSFAGFPSSVLPSPQFSSSLPSQQFSSSLPSQPPPLGFGGVSPAPGGSLPLLLQRSSPISPRVGAGVMLSPSMSPSIASIIAAATATSTAVADSIAMPPPMQPAKQNLQCDSRTSLFSLKECRLALDSLAPVEKRQLQPASSFLGNPSVYNSVNNIPRPRPIQKSLVEVDLRGSDDDNEQSPGYLDVTTSPILSTMLTLRPSSLSSSRRGCGFCLSNGERQRECMSHRLKNPDTLVVECPQLRKFVCPLCQATGDFAHTQGYCPLNDADIPTVKHLKKKRSSAGRLAGGKNIRPDLANAGLVAYGALPECGVNGGSLGVVDPSIIAIGPKGGKRGSVGRFSLLPEL